MTRWLAVLFWCGVIFFFSSQSVLPGPADQWADFFLKKAAHMTVYGILFLLVVRAQKQCTPKHTIAAFLFVFLYAVSDEIHQSFVPGRTPSIRDIGFDLAGATLAFFAQKIRW